MIGTKRLTAIYAEIEQALASSGTDPIQHLERQIASAKRKGNRTEVLEGLKRFLELPRPRRRNHRAKAKNATAPRNKAAEEN